MAALWLPSDDRHAIALREPNLLVPGKKPLNLVQSAFGGDFYGIGSAITSSLNGHSAIASILPVRQGQNWKFSSGNYVRWSNVKFDLTKPFTLIVKHTYNYSGLWCGLFGVRGSFSTDGGINCWTAYAGTIRLKVGTSNADVTGIAGSSWVTHVITFDGTVTKWRVNDREAVTITDTPTNAHSEMVIGARSGNYGTGIADNNFNGSFEALIFLPYCVSDIVAGNAQNNIYQFLRPANQTPFALTLAGGTPSTVTLSDLQAHAVTTTSITPRYDIGYS